MELKEMIKVMQHYEDGGEVESKTKNEDSTNWRPVEFPSWDWSKYTYRIEESNSEVTIEKWLCRKSSGRFVIIETSDIDAYTWLEKFKLLESYEIEL